MYICNYFQVENFSVEMVDDDHTSWCFYPADTTPHIIVLVRIWPHYDYFVRIIMTY